MARKRLPKFKPGHLYVIDYDDHYSSQRVYRQTEAKDTNCMLRSVGFFCHEDADTVVLEHQIVTTDRDPKNQRIDVHGVRKSCIVRVQDFGRERRQ